jgi:hypothetical protein
MVLQTKSGLGLLYWGFITIMFYGVRLLASRSTPVNFGGPMIFCRGLLPQAKSSSFKALKTRPPSHSLLLHNPLCIAPGPPRGGWEFGLAGRACRLNTHEAFWYLTGHAYSYLLATTVYCCGVVSYNASHEMLQFSDLPCVLIWVIITYWSTSGLCLQQRHLVAKQGVGEKWPWI